MPLDTTVKLGPELKVFLSSSTQSFLSIDLNDIATENVGGSIVWEEVGFYRHPIDQSEPIEIVDIYKNFDIDHTKKGRQQRKTLTLVAAFQNTGNALRKYRGKNCLVKLEWHVEGASATDEYEYYKNVRFTGYVRGVPEGEVQERADLVFSTYGKRTGP